MTGAAFDHPTVQSVRRTSLRRSRYYVYYTVDAAALAVTVVAVWHASRGSAPNLT